MEWIGFIVDRVYKGSRKKKVLLLIAGPLRGGGW